MERSWNPSDDISFAFSRLTHANRTAIFTMIREYEGDEMASKFKAFQSRQQSLPRDKLALFPRHIIRFHRRKLINDTELHIIGMNAAMAEISLDWCSFFTSFFIDARLYQNSLKKEWSRRIPNGSCWDSWNPARAKRSKNSRNTRWDRRDMLGACCVCYSDEEVRHECVKLGFDGTDDLDFTNAVSLLKSYSEMDLAARVFTRRKRMKKHIERVEWKDGAEQYFKNELLAIDHLDPEWLYSGMNSLLPGCGAQKWVTLRYSHQPELAKKRGSCEDEATAWMSMPLHAGEEDIRRPRYFLRSAVGRDRTY